MRLHRGQVDADRAEPHRADRQRQREQHPLVGLAGQPAEPGGDVHVGGVEHAGGVELGEQPGARERASRASPGSTAPGPGADRSARRAARRSSRSPSSRSDSSTTSAGGGRQPKTPHGTPSTTGVSGPHMPRTNRYSTPPRWRSRVVARLPPAQVAVQRDRVEQRLQRVVRARSSPRPAAAGCSASGQRLGRRADRAEPVGLVVDDDEAAAAGQPQHRVDAAGEVAAQRLVGQPGRGQAVGVAGAAGRRPAGAGAAAAATVAQRRRSPRRGVVAAGERQLEVELGQPVAGRDVGQPPPAGQRAQRRAQRPAAAPAASASGSTPAAGPAARALGAVPVQLGREVGAVGSASSSTACTSVPNAGARAGRSAIGDGAAAGRPVGAGRRVRRRRGRGPASSVVAAVLVRLAAARRRAHARPRAAPAPAVERGVGRAPPPVSSAPGRTAAVEQRHAAGRPAACRRATAAPVDRDSADLAHATAPAATAAPDGVGGAAHRRRRTPDGVRRPARRGVRPEQQPVQRRGGAWSSTAPTSATTWHCARVSAT